MVWTWSVRSAYRSPFSYCVHKRKGSRSPNSISFYSDSNADAPTGQAITPRLRPISQISARKFAATLQCRTVFACLQLFSIRHLYNAQDLRPKDANRLVRGVCVKSWVEWLLLGRRVDQFQPDMKTCLVKPVGLGVSSWR